MPRKEPTGKWNNAQGMKQMALARLLSLLEEGKLSAADLLRVLAADIPQEPVAGDLVLHVVREDADA